VPTVQSQRADIHGQFRGNRGETLMRGSVTEVSGGGLGCILAEDGNEVYFEKSGISGCDVDDLRVGHWVEFKLQCGSDQLRAVNIKRLHRDMERRPEARQAHG
jgi:cold shock CspA family protein